MKHSWKLGRAALIAAVVLVAPPAAALEPPASEAELQAAAQHIARVEVERVVCLGPPEQEGDWEVTRYRATMRRIETLKGELPERFELVFAEVDAGDDISHSIVFEPRWRGRVFLAGTAPDFGLVRWNGAISDPDRTAGELPSCGGGCAGCVTHPTADSGGEAALAWAALLVALGRRRLSPGSPAASRSKKPA